MLKLGKPRAVELHVRELGVAGARQDLHRSAKRTRKLRRQRGIFTARGAVAEACCCDPTCAGEHVVRGIPAEAEKHARIVVVVAQTEEIDHRRLGGKPRKLAEELLATLLERVLERLGGERGGAVVPAVREHRRRILERRGIDYPRKLALREQLSLTRAQHRGKKQIFGIFFCFS